MALKISEDCINCGACEFECPNEAISMGDESYIIDPDKCTECGELGYDSQCIAVCPVECIFKEEEEEILNDDE